MFNLFRSSKVSSFSTSVPESLKALSEKARALGGIVHHPTNSDLSKPLAVLVGWTLATQKSLGKYAAVYSNLGSPSISFTPSLFYSWNISSYNKYTNNIFKTLNSTYKGSLVLHLFSAAPCVILPRFTQMISELERIDFKGIIFDCAPVLFSYESGVAAGQSMMATGGMNLLTYHLLRYSGIILNAIKGAQIRQDLVEALRRPVLSVPQLYLHSDEDRVMPLKRLHEVMNEQKNLGRDVKNTLFEGAPHVRLLLSDPEKYRKQLASFLEKINLV